MTNYFGGLDVIKILGYGLSGLSLLLMILAFGLLQKIIKIRHPDPSVLSLVKYFLSITVLVLIVVGVFSIPILSRDNALTSDNDQLTTKTKVLLLAEELHSKLDDIQQTTDQHEIQTKSVDVKNLFDSLKLITAKRDSTISLDDSNFSTQIESLSTLSLNPQSVTSIQTIKEHANHLQKSARDIYINPIKKSMMPPSGSENKK